MRKTGEIVKCYICNKEVYKRRKDLLKNKRNFCSRKCQIKTFLGVVPWNKGMKGRYENNPPNAKKDMLLEDKNGRIWIYDPTHPRSHRGRVLLSRQTVEMFLGRYLDSDEIIHHVDHNPKNNKLENLLITNRSEHAKIHRKKI